MKKLKSDVVIMDRLSELPDSLILEILSLLEMTDVVRTTFLSKRWKNLWMTIPCLRFFDRGRDIVKLHNFVYGTLTHWSGTHLREFSIRFHSYIESEASCIIYDMSKSMLFAKEKKVEDLCIEFHCAGHLWRPPQCLYECSSIRKLSLHGCDLQLRGNVKWDRLNSLKLVDCVFSEDVMNQVFYSSLQLETFTASSKPPFQNWSIRSSSLKKLWIVYHDRYYGCNTSVLTIWAPNLQELKYSGKPYVKCLLKDISSLTVVHLNFSYNIATSAVKEALRQILPAIQHVVTVQLSASCFKMLSASKQTYSFSPLSIAKLLTIESLFIKLSDIVGLHETFPKLEKLIISCTSISKDFKFHAKNYTESEASILKSNLLQLQTVVITTRYVYKPSFFEYTGFLLKHATMLKKMVIRRKGSVNSEEMFQATKQLMSLQRSFPSVELILL